MGSKHRRGVSDYENLIGLIKDIYQEHTHMLGAYTYIWGIHMHLGHKHISILVHTHINIWGIHHTRITYQFRALCMHGILRSYFG